MTVAVHKECVEIIERKGKEPNHMFAQKKKTNLFQDALESKQIKTKIIEKKNKEKSEEMRKISS